MEAERTSDANIGEVLQALEAYVTAAGGQSKAASMLGVSRSFLWKVQTGRKRISQDILEQLGYELQITKTYTYIRKKEAA